MTIKQASTSSQKDSNLLHMAIKNNLGRTVEYMIKNKLVSPNQLALIQSIRQPALCLAARLDLC